MDSDIRSKRRYYETQEEVIDMPYLINASRALSAKELKRLFPKASYSSYFNTFLKRRMQDIFKIYSNTQWFKDRFVNNKNANCYIEPSSKTIHIRNISSNASIDDVMDTVRKIIPEECKIAISQNNIDKHFSRELYISLNDESNIESKYAELMKYFDVMVEDLSGLEIVDHSLATEDQRKTLFTDLMKYEKPLIEITEDNTDFSAEMFRKAFNFCLTCCRKFDNNLSMLQNCSKHTKSDFSSRSLDILVQPKEINQAVEFEELLKNHYKKNIDRNFECNECTKVFDSAEHITNHLKNKHENIVLSEITENNKMEAYLKNIDFFIFELAFGTYVKTIPSYAITDIKEDAVVYDLPCIFSGEISFE